MAWVSYQPDAEPQRAKRPPERKAWGTCKRRGSDPSKQANKVTYQFRERTTERAPVAAVVHDWLYWKQDISREVADLALKLGMEELKVPTWKTAAIYRAVRMFGQSAWDDNAKSKIAGEKRILRVVPDDVTVRWSDWKLRPEVF